MNDETKFINNAELLSNLEEFQQQLLTYSEEYTKSMLQDIQRLLKQLEEVTKK